MESACFRIPSADIRRGTMYAFSSVLYICFSVACFLSFHRIWPQLSCETACSVVEYDPKGIFSLFRAAEMTKEYEEKAKTGSAWRDRILCRYHPVYNKGDTDDESV